MSNILLVDDDKVTVQLIKKKLDNRGFNSTVWNRKGSIVEFIQNKKIDLVLLDIMMPNKSGDEFLKEIREKFTTLELPVLMSTSLDEKDKIIDFLTLGANDYLVKPVNIDICVARMKIQLDLKNLARQIKSIEEAKTINKMLNTLSHEIRNPLTIALMHLPKVEKDKTSVKKLGNALERISSIIEEMHNILEEKNLELNVDDNPRDNLYSAN